MTLDISTILAVTVFVSAVGGLLLLFSWLQNRSEAALGLWGVGYLLQAFAMAVLATRHQLAPYWFIAIGPILMALAYGFMWSGARRFEGRTIHWPIAFAGGAIWFAACQFDSFQYGGQPRVILSSMIVAGYTLLCAWELWRAREPDLMSRWPAIVLLLVHAGIFLARVPFAGVLPFPGGVQPAMSNWIPVGVFETMFFTFCLAFLLVNMAKERAELQHRRAALVDPLTGVANRRAFLDQGTRLLRRALTARQTAALLLLDLDRFKEVNDTHGHQTGDRVLAAFSELATSALRPGDLFGRLGGEEFACFLPNVSLAEAIQVAERIRTRFAAATWQSGEKPLRATVSVGVAVSSPEDHDLAALFVAADRALYRAKAAGRDRVEPMRGPLVVMEPVRAAVGA